MRRFAFTLVILLVAVSAAADSERTHMAPGLGDYTQPFWPDVNYNDAIESPADYLGFEIGSRPATNDEIIAYFRYLDERLESVTLKRYATSYEGRDLFYLMVTSSENAARIDAIQGNLAKLADPRKLDGKAETVVAGTPACAWMAYGIHGDELSSCDAALQLAYQIAAGEDDMTRLVREHVVTLIDPMENPDGRARWLKQMEQWNGVVPNDDTQSFQHRGTWPYGRGNHYLFDLNRDWFTQVHPESRGRVKAILEWNPHFVLDCHEMGPTNTYLFSPPRAPFNPFMISQVYKWWDVFAKDQAAAFDRYGWSYYTREWNEEFFPGYGSSWGIYAGAIGMLYEQAGVDGSLVKRPEGTVMTYRETVHHQFVSSMANLITVAQNREALLSDYVAEKQRVVKEKAGAFVFPASNNYSRLQLFAGNLRHQGIEVEVAAEGFKMGKALSGTGKHVKDVEAPPGSMIVKLNQPLRALIEAILTFDIRIENRFLEEQRREVLKNNDSQLYEATGWSMPLAYNLESYFVEKPPGAKTVAYAPSAKVGRLDNKVPTFGYAIDNSDDLSYVLLAHLLERGYKVWAAHKPFQVEGKRFEPGSLLIRLSGNPELDADELADLALTHGVTIHGINTALGGELADLGGNDWQLLERPRIALIGGSAVSVYEFGTVWHLLDSRIGIKTSTIDIASLSRIGSGGFDLRKYNVIVMPGTWYGDAYKRMLGEGGLRKLQDWVRDGGTLIAMGNATAFLADSSTAVTSLRKRAQVLKDIAKYEDAEAWMAAAEAPVVDSLDVWEAKTKKKEEKSEAPPPSPEYEALQKADELAVRLRPRGVIMAVELDPEDWLCYGVRSPVPVMVSTSNTYVAKKNVRTPARFASEEDLRLSGLLWPEARERWAGSVYAAHERQGAGQIIVFAGHPNFRAYFHGGERLLLNAMLLGPGFGARQPIDF